MSTEFNSMSRTQVKNQNEFLKEINIELENEIQLLNLELQEVQSNYKDLAKLFLRFFIFTVLSWVLFTYALASK